MSEQKIIDIKVNYNDAIASVVAVKAQINDLSLKNKELNKDYANNSAEIETNKAKIKELTTQYNANSKQLQLSINDVKGSEGAYQKLNLQYQVAAQRAKDLAAAHGVGSFQAKNATAAADALDTKLKAIDKTVGQNTRNVGNYGSVLSGLPGVFGQIADSGQAVLVKLRNTYDSVAGATAQYAESVVMKKEAQLAATVADEAAVVAETELAVAQKAGTATSEQAAAAETARAAATEASTVATDLGSSSMKLFKVALASTGIGLIIVALGSLIAYFTQTNEGSKLLSKSLSVVGAIFKELIGFVAKGVQGIRDFIGGIKDFPDLMSKIGKSIEENLLNRFKAFSIIFQAIGELLSGDFKKGLKDLADGWIQMGTGVTNATDKMSNLGKTISDGVSDAASAAARIAEMKRALGLMERESITTLADLEKKANEYKLIMGKGGQSLSTKEREDAIKNLIENEDKQLKIKLNISGQKVKIAKAELDLEQKQTGDAMAETKRAYAEAQADYIKTRGEFSISRMSAEARAAKLYLQMLQENVAAEQAMYDQSKSITMNKLKDATLTTEERLALIEKLKQAENTNYEQQKKSFQEYIDETTKGAKKIIDFNELMQISDGETLSKRMQEIGMSIKAQAELLKIITTRKTELLSTNQEEIKIIQEKANLLIASLQNELKINQLYDKEILAGKVLSHQQEIDDLVRTYETDQKILDEKHESGLISEEKYIEDQKLLDQQFKTDKAISDAQDAENKRQGKIAQLSDELSLVAENSDMSVFLKKKQLDIEHQNEIKNATKTGEDVNVINKKYAKLKSDIDKEALNAKLDQAGRITNGLVDLLGKETLAGKLAAAATVSIDTYKSASLAIGSMAGSGPVGWAMGAIEAGVIIAGGLASVANIMKVDTSVSKASPSSSTATSTVTSSYHSGGIAGQDADSNLKSNEVTATLLKGEQILNIQQKGIFDNILQNVSSLGGSSGVTSGVGTNSVNQLEALKLAFSQALKDMKNPIVSWNEFALQAQRQQQLEQNKMLK